MCIDILRKVCTRLTLFERSDYLETERAFFSIYEELHLYEGWRKKRI